MGRYTVTHNHNFRHALLILTLHPQFYAKVSEAESWMNDKKPLVGYGEYGKDEDSTTALIKKHEAVELDIEGYSSRYVYSKHFLSNHP